MIYLKRYACLCLFLLLLLILFWRRSPVAITEEQSQEELQHETAESAAYAGVYASFQEHILDAGVIPPNLRCLTPKEQSTLVYTFLQGPKAYERGLAWSGDWCEKIVGYNRFGGFGCGFCCMANIYSTLTDYECSPWDMYEFAISASDYYPTAESGAIGWKELKKTLHAAGFDSRLYRKPSSYEAFQEQMKQAKSAIVLVSSANDSTFWANTPGHYVNLWLYQEDSDQVFLAEPGNPDNNRTWIPLRYAYDALKTVSQFQYLLVMDYSEDQNGWKANGIDDNWNGKYGGEVKNGNAEDDI